MTDTVRCPACLGAKKVPKLGGMIGECNTCVGKGTILAINVFKPAIVTLEQVIAKELISQVSEALPVSNVPLEPEKVEKKKALYRRKTSSSV